MDAHDLISDYFDEIYPHDSYAEELDPIKRDVLQRVIRNYQEKKIRVLDICTGTGRALGVFDSDDTFELTGIDISSKLIVKAREKYKTARFVQCDALHLADAFDGELFDCILISGVSLQLFAPQKRITIFSQVKELLCNGGALYFDIFLDMLKERKALIKLSTSRSNEEILVVYRREPSVPSMPWKQHVDLFRKEIGSNRWTGLTNTVYIYNVTLDEIRNEIKSTGLKLTDFKLKREHTIFLKAVKDAES